MASSEAFSSSSSDNSSEEDDGTWLDTANRNFQFDEPGDFELPVPPASAVPPPDNAFNVRIPWTIPGHRLIGGNRTRSTDPQLQSRKIRSTVIVMM